MGAYKRFALLVFVIISLLLIVGAVPSGKWLEFEGGVISGSFNQPGPALSRRRRSRHDDG
jgi:hypothetical protein